MVRYRSAVILSHGTIPLSLNQVVTEFLDRLPAGTKSAVVSEIIMQWMSDNVGKRGLDVAMMLIPDWDVERHDH